MSTITFYRWSLLIPIAVPVALLAFAGGNSAFAGVAELFLMSLLYGGIPYLLTLALLARPLLHGDEQQYNRLTWIAPPIMVAVQVVCGFTFGLCSQPTDRWGGAILGFQFALMLAVYTVTFGYGYVALTRAGLWLAHRIGLVY